MPATQIAQNLAFINWTVLSALAFGSYGAVVLLRRRSAATSGFLGFTAVSALVFGLLAWLSDGGLPDTLGGSPVVVDPTWDGPRRTAILAFVVLGAAAVVVRRFRPAAGRGLDLAAVGAALLTLLFGALSWGGSSPSGIAGLLVQLAVLAAATGGVFAAMILGHWYLVTPKLPESPLLLLSRVLVAVIAIKSGCSRCGWPPLPARPEGRRSAR